MSKDWYDRKYGGEDAAYERHLALVEHYEYDRDEDDDSNELAW